MDKKLFIRGMYWYGTFLDGLMGVIMLISTCRKTIIIPYSSSSMEYQFAMGWAATLMFGWTGLLFWGSFKPLERKGVLLLTAFPVVSGLIITEMLVDFTGLSNIWLFQLLAIMLPLLISYYFSLNLK